MMDNYNQFLPLDNVRVNIPWMAYLNTAFTGRGKQSLIFQLPNENRLFILDLESLEICHIKKHIEMRFKICMELLI